MLKHDAIIVSSLRDGEGECPTCRRHGTPAAPPLKRHVETWTLSSCRLCKTGRKMLLVSKTRNIGSPTFKGGAGWSIIPQEIAFINRNIVFLKKRTIFVREGTSVMVFFLFFDVSNNHVLITKPITKCCIFTPPPTKGGEGGILLQPFATSSFYALHKGSKRERRRQRCKDMDMVWHSSYPKDMTTKVCRYTIDICIQLSIMLQ